MSISLSKGQRIDLTKTNPGLTKVIVGLGWDTNKYAGSQDFDLDACAFLANKSSQVVNDEEFVFYNNLKSPNGAVEHTGDNRTGAGDGDDEKIAVDFSLLPDHVEKIGISVTIHDADARGQNFGQVSNAFVRLIDAQTNEEVLRYDLGEDFSIETAVVVCELYKHGNDWKFNAIGSGFSGGLADLCRNYGLSV
ncbi:TerD family protein [Priestia megaterium]|uniref:TerD family protein n=1 Tax=Priestia megaterium TaxID=1404 RepID=UPI000BFCF1FD|nr:TerD family protein [Priestia megaterium]PGY48933.1 chemical-damaging agent resistance protein C [Priestia megaterium]